MMVEKIDTAKGAAERMATARADAEARRPNSEGLTFPEWAAAAGFNVRSYLEVRKAILLAWYLGEDPTDWRKAGERSAEATLDAETE